AFQPRPAPRHSRRLPRRDRRRRPPPPRRPTERSLRNLRTGALREHDRVARADAPRASRALGARSALLDRALDRGDAPGLAGCVLQDVSGEDRAMKRLIVNADDFGASHGINRAVVESVRRGIVTSASLLVNAARSDEAASMSREVP